MNDAVDQQFKIWRDRAEAAESALKRIEATSDSVINAEHYTAENAISDLLTIRSTIKRYLLEVRHG